MQRRANITLRYDCRPGAKFARAHDSGMNKQTILKILEEKLIPRIGDMFYSHLKDVEIELKRISECIAELSDRIDAWGRGDLENDEIIDGPEI